MTLFSRMQTSRFCILCAALALPLLSGCQSGQSIVARLSDATITDADYRKQLERLGINNFEQTLALAGHPYVAGQATDPNLDAGAVALIEVLRERAIDQLAIEANAVPTKEMIDQYYKYQELQNPKLDQQVKLDPQVEADLKRSIKIKFEVIGVGTDGAKADDKELQDEFTAAKTNLDIPERFGLRLLRVPSETEGQAVLNRLKATGNFPEEAAKEQARPPLNGQEQFWDVKSIQTQKSLYDAVQPLKPGQYAPAPVAITGGPPGTPPVFLVVELTQRIPARPATLDFVRGPVTLNVLQHKFPDFQAHFFQRLTEFFQKHASDLEIYDKHRDKLVLAYLMAPPPQPSAPGGAPNPAQGAPPGGSPSGGGSAPPPSGGGRPSAPPSSSSGSGVGNGLGNGGGSGKDSAPGNGQNNGKAGAP